MTFDNQEFHGVPDRDSARLFEDLEFRGCYFQGCGLSITEQPQRRSIVRNITLSQCSQRGCSLDAAVVEDTLVDGFATNGQLFQTWGAVFKRVILKGKIDRLMISQTIGAGMAAPDVQAAFDKANAEYYRDVDWALDISEGEFKELEIRGMPARLVRRDPETQVVVTRKQAELGEWRKLDFCEKLTPFSIAKIVERGAADKILVAGRRHPKFKRYLQDLQLLRKAGIAEPD